MAGKILTVLIAIYALACTIALTVAVIGIYGEPSAPLAGVFAIVLAAPWVFVLGMPGLETPGANLILLISYMALNVAVLLFSRRLLRRHRRGQDS